jgi:hypothetical protein
MKDTLYKKWSPILSLLKNLNIIDDLLNYCEKNFTNKYLIHTLHIIDNINQNIKLYYSLNYKKDIRKFKTNLLLYNIKYYNSKNIKVKLSDDDIDDLNFNGINIIDYSINMVRHHIIKEINDSNYKNILIGNIIKNIYLDREKKELLIETEYILY